jgi:hypothetical protein
MDGAGAQAQAVLSTQLFAAETGIQYVHTPFQSLDHHPSGSDAAAWAQRWESFLNLGEGERPIGEIGRREFRVRRIKKPRHVKQRFNVLYVIEHCHTFADRRPDLYRKHLDKFRGRYHDAAKDDLLRFSEGVLKVAAHLRRGDALQDENLADRVTEDDFALRVLEQVRTALDHSRVSYEMHVYSQGRREDFAAFEHRGAIVHLDDDPFAAFHNLVCADVLIMAKSSFSYTAALLSRGVKIYESFWHKPLSEWTPVGADGPFDTARLSRMISEDGR